MAIDLGTNNISAVVGLRNQEGRISVKSCATAELEGMVRGEIKNIEQVVSGIRGIVDQLEKNLDIKIRDIYTGISGQHIRCVKYPYYVFVGRDGEVREEDVRKLHESMGNVQAPDGETIIQIMPQSYSIDGEETASPVGAFGNKLEATFTFILGDNNAANRLKRAFTRAELKQAGVFVNAIASAEAVASEDEKEEGVAIVDIGAGMTDLTIFYKGIVRHVAILPMGGNIINKDIRSYGILERHVENLKVKYGVAMRDKAPADKFITTPGLNSRVPKEISFQNLAAIIEARMMDIADFVTEEINTSGYKEKLGAGVILTGGGARLQDLESFFKGYTGLDVRVACADICSQSVAEAKDPSYATAIGILIKGLDASPAAASKPVFPVTGVQRSRETEELGKENIKTPPRPINGYDNEKPFVEEEDPGYTDDYYGEDRPPKRGIFSKWKDKFNNMFDVIEDNEI